MDRLLQLLKTTLVGGLLFLVPFLAALVLLQRGMKIAAKILAPVVKLMPIDASKHVLVADIAGVILLLLIALCAGLIANTKLGQQVRTALENKFLHFIPGYTIFQGIFHGSSEEDSSCVEVVLAHLDTGWVWGFQMEAAVNGFHTVFIPSAPTPLTGQVYVLPESEIRKVSIPTETVLKCIRRLGLGTQQHLSAHLNTTNL